ncbi:Fe-S-cluster containining protein [Oxalobacteraceae bacterium GrIS 1.11]
MNKKRIPIAVESAPPALPAGEFSVWLAATRKAQQVKDLGADVPCGACNACCRAAYFIHIKPEESQALKRIPKALLFAAPGLPKGNVLMGYNEKGECPMLVEGQCSIYAHRPQTCRDYDCRIHAATGIALDGAEQALIAARVRSWQFSYPQETDRKQYAAVRAAATFLREHKDCFPAKTLPGNPAELAILAIKVYQAFCGADQAATRADADIARAVMETFAQFEAGQGH